MFGEFFGTNVRVFAVSSGTAANSLALATFCPSWGTVLTHAEAHIERDECGAPEFFTGGAKLSLVGGAGAKILPQDLLARLAWFEPHVHGVQPRMLSITQATERGAMYTRGGSPRARRYRPRARHVPACGRRALRECAGRAECVARPS